MKDLQRARVRRFDVTHISPAATAGGLGLLWIVLLFIFGSPELVRWSGRSLGALLLLGITSIALYIVPGLALLRLCWRGRRITVSERLALAWGVGIALQPLLLELAHLVRLPWTAVTTYSYVGLMALLLVWRQPLPALSFSKPSGVTTHVQRSPYAHRLRMGWSAILDGVLLAGLVLVALLVRMFMVRDLPVGMWGDSYHHTMIAQLLVDNRGLFDSWEPYAPLITFTYHFGFHANVAFWHWLSGTSVPDSLIVVGQVHNTAVLLMAYVLTSILTRDRRAGLWAAALTGFVNTMPVYYVNWGRYTQLTGQLILPVVLICWMELIESKIFSWRLIILAAILTAGLMLTHYIVTGIAAVFVAAYLVVWIIRRPSWGRARRVIIRAAPAAGLALLLAAPWLMNTFSGYLGRNTVGFVNQSVGAERIASESALVAITPFYLKPAILWLAIAGVVLALACRNWRVLLAAVWTVLLLLMVVPYVIGLPGGGVVKNFTAYIMLYLPAIPLAAYVLGYGQARLAAWRPWLATTGMVLGLVASTLWGVRWQQSMVNPANQLVLPADMEAMSWIRVNTAPDDEFLVNMFPAYNNSLVAGSDAGWWIPLLTGRGTTLPPITYGSERAADPDYSRRINAFAAALREHPLPDEEGIRLLREAGIDYVFSGAHRGQEDAIDVEALRGHPAFRVVYDRDGTTIFQLLPGT